MIKFKNFLIDKNLDIAWDINQPEVLYEKNYFEKYKNYENTEISKKLIKHRTNLVKKYSNNNVLDFGIGSGEFIKNLDNFCYGFDINPFGIQWLNEKALFLDPYQEDISHISVITFWDSLEHLKNPKIILDKILPKQIICISIPIFKDLFKIKESKHYRPGEHFFYATIPGIIRYMKESNLEILEISDQEIEAGREDIYSFVFKKQSV